jgi:nitronate monooxygenase
MAGGFRAPLHATLRPMPLRTRLTDRFNLDHPIISAPMGMVAGGKLAAAVSNAGGLGLIGGGYGDADWLDTAFADAGNAKVGCGFITWSLAKRPELLDRVLAHAPAALMLSFGSPLPFAPAIAAANVHLICQVQTLAHAREAIEAGASVIVAQGGEAGGHTGTRATLTLVPEIADLLAKDAPEIILVAAGGIADGRGLAAALMLGAEGVLVGSRFLASTETLQPPGFQQAILAASGDDTVKTHLVDIVRNYAWPEGWSGRALRTTFIERWHGRDADLAEPSANATENARFWEAFRTGDAANAGVFAAEAVGIIGAVQPAAEIIETMVSDAERLLGRTAPGYVRR